MRLACIVFLLAGILSLLETQDAAEKYLELSAKSAGYGAFAENASFSELVLLDEFGPEALMAERAYPGKAIELFALFGDTKEWQEVLPWYGWRQAIPVVWWYHENDSVLFSAQNRVGSFVQATIASFKERAIVKPETVELNNETRAWMAICAIHESGNNFLGRFSRPTEKGEVKPVVSREVIAVTENFFVGGIQAFEEKYRRGDDITAGDAAMASLEVAGFALVGLAGAKRLARLTRAGKTGKRVSRAGRMALAVPKAVRSSRALRGVIYATVLYGAWKHPGVVNALFDGIAELVGLPSGLVRFALWSALLFPLVGVLLPFLFFLRRLARMVGRRKVCACA